MCDTIRMHDTGEPGDQDDNRGSSRRGLVFESLIIYCDFMSCINIILCII